jgi:hypothetical protein
MLIFYNNYVVEKTKTRSFETSGFAPNKMAVIVRYEVGMVSVLPEM